MFQNSFGSLPPSAMRFSNLFLLWTSEPSHNPECVRAKGLCLTLVCNKRCSVCEPWNVSEQLRQPPSLPLPWAFQIYFCWGVNFPTFSNPDCPCERSLLENVSEQLWQPPSLRLPWPFQVYFCWDVNFRTFSQSRMRPREKSLFESGVKRAMWRLFAFDCFGIALAASLPPSAIGFSNFFRLRWEFPRLFNAHVIGLCSSLVSNEQCSVCLPLTVVE